MSGKINSYKDMIVWQKGIDLVVNIYAITKSFPDYEKFGLVNQMRRAAVSIPCNIAEGQAQRTKDDYKRYLRILNKSATTSSRYVKYLLLSLTKQGSVTSNDLTGDRRD